MKTADFDYELPEELIAQTPMEPRDHSRLLVVHRKDGRLEHRHFYDIIDYLNPGDALVINETRVIPARLLGEKEHTGVPVEVLLLRRENATDWEALVRPGRRLKKGVTVSFGGGILRARIGDTTDAGGRVVCCVVGQGVVSVDPGSFSTMTAELNESSLSVRYVSNSFAHVSSADLKSMLRNEGDIKLLSTGNFDGFTTRECAGENINCGEVIALPSGGAANVKYWNGNKKYYDKEVQNCNMNSNGEYMEYPIPFLMCRLWMPW